MKKKLFLLATLTSLGIGLAPLSTFGNVPAIAIAEENKEEKTLETTDAILTFSNPRWDGKELLLDVDINVLKSDSYAPWTQFAFDLNFEQEDDVSIHKVSGNYNLKKTDNDDRLPINLGMKLKSGANAKTVLALKDVQPELPLYIRTTTIGSGNMDQQGEVEFDLSNVK